jgi:signal transduction histidine kinase
VLANPAMDPMTQDAAARRADRTGRLTRAGLNLIPQALSIYDGDLKLAVSNARFAEMFGLPPHLTENGADFGATIRFLAESGEYGPVDDVERFVQERVDQARAFEPHYMERTRANGRTISVEGSPLRQGGWVTVYTDITEIKRQETLLRARSENLSDRILTYSEDIARTNRELAATIAALEEAQRSLTASEALVRGTTEMMPAHIAHVDLDERYTYSNRKLASVIPGRPVEIVGLTAREALGPQAYEAIRPHLATALGGGASVFEFTHTASHRRIRAAFTPGRDPSGAVTGVYILSMDVTEEAQARAALAQTHKRELAAQLTSGLAHDFANLLTIILGLQGRLEKLHGLPDEAREMIATTRAAALRGGVLLDRLSDISGKRDLRPVATDLGLLFQDIRALASPSLPDGIQLDLAPAEMDRAVMVDAGFLQDSLLNLILNARDAIGGSEGRITLAARTIEDTWLELTVDDSGPGFTPEALDHAVDPFYTTKRDTGSGLGLPMVYDFAQLSGGHLRIANAPRGGGHVTLRLPLKWAEHRAEPRLVLLVEDDDDIRATIRAMLRDLGHSVIEAASADEAETLADIPGVDVVLSDIMLAGGRTGLDLARALAARPHPPRIHLMTSRPATDAVRTTAEAEFPLLAKPFALPELARHLAPESAP